jgi:hypothetical protein
MLVLGLGLGMVMQVLVMAVQNAVDYRNLGVATSGTTLFRSTGGSVGVSLFGAIFAANLASGLASRMPAGAALPNASDAAAIAVLPPGVRGVYLEVFTAALHPVFLSAAAIAAFAFVLTWFLKEIPLLGGERSETIGESFAMPHDATSLEELELIVTRLGLREHRWETYRRIAEWSGVSLAPDEMWLLAQLCREAGGLPGGRIDRALEPIAMRLLDRGLLTRESGGGFAATEAGRRTFEQIVAGYRARLAQILERWSPEDHEEVRAMLNGLARELVAELPASSGRPAA